MPKLLLHRGVSLLTGIAQWGVSLYITDDNYRHDWGKVSNRKDSTHRSNLHGTGLLAKSSFFVGCIMHFFKLVNSDDVSSLKDVMIQLM